MHRVYEDTNLFFCRRCEGKEDLQFAMWDFSFGMLGCALLHLWHRSSIASIFSSLLAVADPCCSISSMTSTESRKNGVVKEFQCFLFFKLVESKSWLIMWRCSCRIDGTCKRTRHLGLLSFAFGLKDDRNDPSKSNSKNHSRVWFEKSNRLIHQETIPHMKMFIEIEESGHYTKILGWSHDGPDH